MHTARTTSDPTSMLTGCTEGMLSKLGHGFASWKHRFVLKNICLNENTGFVTSHHAIIMGEGSWTLKDGECNNTIAVGDLA